MALLNDKYNYLFLAEPHTASRSIRTALMEHEGSYEVGWHHDTCRVLQDKYGVNTDNYYTFRVVRHPADVLITMWLNSHEHREKPLRLFMDIVFKNHNRLFYRFEQDSSVWIKYEELPGALNGYLAAIGAPDVHLGHAGATPGKHPFKEYYGQVELQLARGYVHLDLIKYNYGL